MQMVCAMRRCDLVGRSCRYDGKGCSRRCSCHVGFRPPICTDKIRFAKETKKQKKKNELQDSWTWRESSWMFTRVCHGASEWAVLLRAVLSACCLLVPSPVSRMSNIALMYSTRCNYCGHCSNSPQPLCTNPEKHTRKYRQS